MKIGVKKALLCFSKFLLSIQQECFWRSGGSHTVPIQTEVYEWFWFKCLECYCHCVNLKKPQTSVTLVFARVFGRSLPEMPSLETLEIIGIGGILRAEDMEALFGGFTKIMPLRSLTFNNFSVRWCLAPLIRKLRFYLNLEDLDLKMLNLDCLDLCGVLEALRLVRR